MDSQDQDSLEFGVSSGIFKDLLKFELDKTVEGKRIYKTKRAARIALEKRYGIGNRDDGKTWEQYEAGRRKKRLNSSVLNKMAADLESAGPAYSYRLDIYQQMALLNERKEMGVRYARSVWNYTQRFGYSENSVCGEIGFIVSAIEHIVGKDLIDRALREYLRTLNDPPTNTLSLYPKNAFSEPPENDEDWWEFWMFLHRHDPIKNRGQKTFGGLYMPRKQRSAPKASN